MLQLNSKGISLLLLLTSILILIPYPHINYVNGQSATPSPTPILGTSLKTTQQIQRLMVADSDCQLPCFWQFRPGKTTLSEVLRFIGINFREDLKNKMLEYDYYEPGTTPPVDPLLTIGFDMNDDKLRLITVDVPEPNFWLPGNTLEVSTLLQKINPTSEVYLAINVTTRLFSLVIVDDSQGVMLQYWEMQITF